MNQNLTNLVAVTFHKRNKIIIAKLFFLTKIDLKYILEKTNNIFYITFLYRFY